jgi:SAM-dependent methyltransferase
MIKNFVEYLNSLDVLQETFPADPMNNGPPFYYLTGKSALRAMLTALTARLGYIGGDKEIKSILDFGSGYGRVTRWMRAAFPDAQITVTDLNMDAANWCASRFNAVARSDALSEASYDLIFLGSVFTHLPADAIVSWFDRLIASLAPNGVLIFTASGRYGREAALNHPESRIHRGIDQEGLRVALAEYLESGIGFVPNRRTPPNGSTWISPSWFFKQFGSRTDTVQIMFQEKGWNNFQDVYAYLKAPIGQEAKSRL